MSHLSEEKFNKRRLISTYFSVVLSISLVLFLTGIIGILLVNSKKVADHFKEQIVMTIYVKDSAKEIELKQLQKTLRLNAATRNVVYVSKAEASKRHANEIGEDFFTVCERHFDARFVVVFPVFFYRLGTIKLHPPTNGLRIHRIQQHFS